MLHSQASRTLLGVNPQVSNMPTCVWLLPFSVYRRACVLSKGWLSKSSPTCLFVSNFCNLSEVYLFMNLSLLLTGLLRAGLYFTLVSTRSHPQVSIRAPDHRTVGFLSLCFGAGVDSSLRSGAVAHQTSERGGKT